MVAAAFTSSIVTLSIVYTLHFLDKDGMRDKSPIPANESATSHSALEAQIASLDNEMELIQKRLSGYEAASGAQKSPVMFEERIAQIELALDNLSSDVSGSGAKNSQIAPKKISESMGQNREVVADQTRELMETQFESDSGQPLGDFSSSIEDVIQHVDGIQAQGIDCRNTICKVSYANDDALSSEPEDVGWQIMEKLLERSGGKQVDIKYANDSYGNNIMYIQLN